MCCSGLGRLRVLAGRGSDVSLDVLVVVLMPPEPLLPGSGLDVGQRTEHVGQVPSLEVGGGKLWRPEVRHLPIPSENE